jgi:hypothetical protein
MLIVLFQKHGVDSQNQGLGTGLFFWGKPGKINYIHQAQTTTKDNNLDGRIRASEDRMALKELVEIFSNLADQKDVQAQTLLFTESASVELLTQRRG